MRRKYRSLGAELHIVELTRTNPQERLGLELIGENTDLYVSEISTEGVVAQDGRIQIGKFRLKTASFNSSCMHQDHTSFFGCN